MKCDLQSNFQNMIMNLHQSSRLPAVSTRATRVRQPPVRVFQCPTKHNISIPTKMKVKQVLSKGLNVPTASQPLVISDMQLIGISVSQSPL